MMTFLFKNKVITLLLLPFIVHAPLLERKIYDLEASIKYPDRIELTWKSYPLSNGEIIEIQRSLHDEQKYMPLKLSDVQKRNVSTHYTDRDNLKPLPSRYDYRIGTFNNGKQVSDWSNIAVGALAAVAQGDSTMKSMPCSANLTLNNVVETSKGIFQLSFAYAHDCGKEHLAQVFLSKDRALNVQEDLLLKILEQKPQSLKVQTLTDAKAYEFLILVIGNQVDVVKIK